MADWTILFICTGNTCRSPMAELLAKDLLAKQRGVSIEQLEKSGIHVTSAGTSAFAGRPAAEHACQVMSEMGLDLSGHQSQLMTNELAEKADLIYCLTDAHRQSLLAICPKIVDKTHLLDPQGNDVADPFGSSQTVYLRCAEMIRQQLAQRLKES